MRRLFLAIACCAPLLGAAGFGNQADPAAAGMNPERLQRISKRMREFVDAAKTAGEVTLIARHGHLALFSATGYRDLESQAPMRTDTIFRIMSMTKPMTAIAVMLLVEEGTNAPARHGQDRPIWYPRHPQF
jgi:CubicO group peptidase (beta-lactamase class C family)